METPEYAWLIEQKNIMLDKTISLAKRLQEARKNIATPYVLALEKQFSTTDVYELIRIADTDLQKSDEHYKQLTNKLLELQEFSQGPFQGLVRLIKKTRH
jgi:hypothetical protein